MCFTDQDAKVSILAERGAKKIEAAKSQQQKSPPGGQWFYRGKLNRGIEK